MLTASAGTRSWVRKTSSNSIRSRSQRWPSCLGSRSRLLFDGLSPPEIACFAACGVQRPSTSPACTPSDKSPSLTPWLYKLRDRAPDRTHEVGILAEHSLVHDAVYRDKRQIDVKPLDLMANYFRLSRSE